MDRVGDRWLTDIGLGAMMFESEKEKRAIQRWSLERELPRKVWDTCKLTDVDRHELAREWMMMAKAYDPEQFHVSRSGLALLVAFVLHMIDIRHATIPV